MGDYLANMLFVHAVLWLGVTATTSEWQKCNRKCYNFETSPVVFEDLNRFCNNQTVNAKPVNFEAQTESEIEHELSACHLRVETNEAYWINNYPGQHNCRAVSFVGTSARLHQSLDCHQKARPICEMGGRIDSTTASRRCQKTEGWFKFSPNSSYCLTNQVFSYEQSVKECKNTNATLADLTLVDLYDILSNLGVGENAMLTIWSKLPTGVNGCKTTADNPGCVFTFLGPRNFTTVPDNLLSTHRALCQRYTATTTTTTPTTQQVPSVSVSKWSKSTSSAEPYDTLSAQENSTHISSFEDQHWYRINDEEYLVSSVPRTYLNSSIFCENMNAALMSFLNPVQYFEIMLQLNASNDSFWIGGEKEENVPPYHECLSLDGKHNSILMSTCTDEKACVCSRHKNYVAVVEDPEFKQMLQKMTVNKTETAKTVRSLKSAEDKRRSAQTAGLISASILCAFGAIIVLMDCSRLAFFRSNRN